MIYEWKSGSRHTMSAAIAGSVCEKLEASGRLTAAALVDESRPEDAPLHAEFDWCDASAAEKWREQQARCIINHLTVIHEQSTEELEPVRAFFVLPHSEKNGNYEAVARIVSDAEKRSQLLDMAKRELFAFERKWRGLQELTPVFMAIDEL